MNNIEILKDLEKYISFANKQCNFSNDADYKWHKELAGMIENLIQENKELKEYKKIAELTKISCCTAQNCEALNNAIKNGLENEKLLQENKELKEKYLLLNQINDIEKSQHRKSMKELLKDINNNYIPKSKLKEKIERLNYGERIKFYTEDKKHYYETNSFNEAIKYVLQELLEEGE